MRKRLTGFLGGRSAVNETHTAEAPTRIRSGQAASLDASDEYGEGPTRLHRPLYTLPDADQDGGEDPTRPNRGRLSAAPVTPSAEAPTRPSERQSGVRKHPGRQQILIAAQDDLVALDLSQMLQQSGYRVSGAATSAGEALELVAGMRPDLVVIDVHLRGAVDAVDAAHEIQRRFGVPVILLLSVGDFAARQPAPTFQPVAFISKPYRAADLLATVAAAIQPPVFDDFPPD
ncbi:MAG TPA: response regulator [Aggregatilineales bacterium]|nr:response regulator [Aggregatilineales bacterium]